MKKTPSPDLAGFCEGVYPRLVGTLSLHSGDAEAARELSQEALVRVCQHWKRVRTMENPEAWVFRVGINLSNSRIRRAAIERRVYLLSRPSKGHEDSTTGSDVRLTVARMLAALPQRQRWAIILRHYLDMPVRDVATIMDCPETTAKTLLQRGLKKLRDDPSISALKEVQGFE